MWINQILELNERDDKVFSFVWHLEHCSKIPATHDVNRVRERERQTYTVWASTNENMWKLYHAKIWWHEQFFFYHISNLWHSNPYNLLHFIIRLEMSNELWLGKLYNEMLTMVHLLEMFFLLTRFESKTVGYIEFSKCGYLWCDTCQSFRDPCHQINLIANFYFANIKCLIKSNKPPNQICCDSN